MKCNISLQIPMIFVLVSTGMGSVFAQTSTTTSTKTTETHPDPNTIITTTVTTTKTLASPTQASRNPPTPTPTPTTIPTPTPTPTTIPTPTPTTSSLVANRTLAQSSAASGQRPITENAGEDFLEVVDIDANRQQAPENIAENVLDTNQSTRWSGKGQGTWIRADLGSEKPIEGVGIAWYKGASRQSNFEISVSNTTEGNDFVKVFTGQSSGTTDSPERYGTEGIQGQYLRITVNGNTDSKASSRDWASITTLEVYP